LRAIADGRSLNAALGFNGRQFFERNYAWSVIEQKYLDMLARLSADERAKKNGTGLEPEPGWLARRRRTLRPATEVLAELPSGPVMN
jgi:hypothetical protein